METKKNKEVETKELQEEVITISMRIAEYQQYREEAIKAIQLIKDKLKTLERQVDAYEGAIEALKEFNK